MKRLTKFSMTALGAAILLTASAHAQALGRLADVSIVDRDTGAVLCPHYYRGEYWVAGTPGSRYAIEIRNRLGERVLAVTSVDGINVVTGATANWDQGGYVFGPSEQYRITGWRKSSTAVAAFTFTDASRSYADLTGRPANVGVIGIALFRERPVPMLYSPSLGEPERNRPEAPQAKAQGSAPSAAQSEDAPAARESDVARTQSQLAVPLAAPKLGTGHGEREYSYVSRTAFARMQGEPNEVIRIRYDSLENLLAMGIVPRPRPTPPTANPFPGSSPGAWVPDPPG